MINIPVSAGELFDKLSILCIKLDKIKDDNKLKLVNKELEELILICDVVAHKHKHSVKELEKLQSELLIVNTELWDIEDDIRIKEKNKELRDIISQEDVRRGIKTMKSGTASNMPRAVDDARCMRVARPPRPAAQLAPQRPHAAAARDLEIDL